jgi:hypothetical protein
MAADGRKLRLEEQHLAELRHQAGPPYADYQRDTKALIPDLF